MLGPLLFLLFQNDFPTIAESCETNMFADDTETDLSLKTDFPEGLEINTNIDPYRLKYYIHQDHYNKISFKYKFMLVVK